MKPTLLAAALLSAAAFSAPAFAQGSMSQDQAAPSDSSPAMVSSRPVPDTAQASPGVTGPDSVNPAPGTHGPYVGGGRQGFYDVDSRIADFSQKVASLPAGQRGKAKSELKSIRAEEATQKARHGELRDWDRENINHRLDQMAQQFPALGSASVASN